MDNNTAVLERRTDHTAEPLGSPPLPRRTSWAPAVLMAAGLACMGLAGGVVSRADDAKADAEPRRPLVTVTAGTYEEGHSSGWHVHPGLHSVVVLTGSLTVYDEGCQRRHFGAGDVYLGGDRPHLVRNESPATVTYAVTYARLPAAAPDPGTMVAAPSGCDLR